MSTKTPHEKAAAAALYWQEEAADLRRALDFLHPISRCPGGRPILRGYVCPHCDHDSSEDPKHCPKPRTTSTP